MGFKKGNTFGKINANRKRLDVSIRMKQDNPMQDKKNIQKMINTVNKKIQEGWVHKGRYCPGMIGTNTGKSFNALHRKKLSESNKGKHINKTNNEKNGNWKGDNVNYSALHAWVKRKLGNVNKCYICSESNKKIQLANISGEYKRDLMDWTCLCQSCHYKFDRKIPLLSKDDLIDFENNIVNLYLHKKIRSPIHLSGGNEAQIIKIFNLINKDDIIYTTYRSHYDSLLHGVSKKWLIKWILKNKSIHVHHKNPDILSSAIVGGTIPLAIGMALGVKLNGNQRRIWCMIGDMTATTGVFWEGYNYALRNDLPIVFVISDNGLSTDTPTKCAWGMKISDKHWFEERPLPKLIYYKYERTRPHYGCGKFVEFDK